MATKATKAPVKPNKDEQAAEVTKRRLAGESWATIGQAMGFAPRTARALYQRANGAHSHHGTLPGKGGRYPQGYVAPTAEGVKGAHTAPWSPGTGTGLPGTMGGAIPATPAPKAPARKRASKAAAK